MVTYYVKTVYVRVRIIGGTYNNNIVIAVVLLLHCVRWILLLYYIIFAVVSADNAGFDVVGRQSPLRKSDVERSAEVAATAGWNARGADLKI